MRNVIGIYGIVYPRLHESDGVTSHRQPHGELLALLVGELLPPITLASTSIASLNNNNNEHAYAGTTYSFAHLRVLLGLTDRVSSLRV